MTYQASITDRDFGTIYIRWNRRARNFTFRPVAGCLCCTCSPFARETELRKSIEALRPRLKEMMERDRQKHERSQEPDTELLRRQAQAELLPRLKKLAEARSLTFQSATIRKTRTRWGSCSAKGNISLSLYLMLVPTHLQDYVMQHELTHLLEMNHGPRFWLLLDEVCGGAARALRDELRHYKTDYII